MTVINTQMDTKINWGGRLHYTALQPVKQRRTKASSGGIATRPVSLRRVIVTRYADSPVTKVWLVFAQEAKLQTPGGILSG